MSKNKWKCFTVEKYNKKLTNIRRQTELVRNVKRKDLCNEGVKYAMIEIISEANSILAHIKHEEARRGE